jgi:hypothetical protein
LAAPLGAAGVVLVGVVVVVVVPGLVVVPVVPVDAEPEPAVTCVAGVAVDAVAAC